MNIDNRTLRVAIIGHGKMGKLIEQLLLEQGHEIIAVIDEKSPDIRAAKGADVAIDFSTQEIVVGNAIWLVGNNIPVVIGTTGWHHQLANLQAIANRDRGAVLYGTNFSVGVNLFWLMCARAGEIMKTQGYGAWVIESHHAAKTDAPSGTAKTMLSVLRDAGYEAPIDTQSIRAGHIVGTHQLGFSSPQDQITIEHMALNRTGFAVGAIEGAKWIIGKRGCFEFRNIFADMIGL